METVFSNILNMSLTASAVILFVIAARLLLRRAPKIYSYALWAVVLFRLLCPISLSAPISLLATAQVPVTPVTVPQNPEQSALTTTIRYVSIGTDREEWELPKTIEELEARQQEPKVKLPLILAYVWLLGVGCMGLYSTITYLRLRRCLAGAVCYRGNVYLADNLPSAFVLGILLPKIYLPSDTPHRERQYIITHERHHIRRGDHILKWLAYLALCLHWFNPLVWLAFSLAGKDMEMSCDEAVLKRLGEGVRAEYAATLLRRSTQRRMAGAPLSFGEGDTKSRVLNMANWKRPKLWVSVLCLLCCMVILAACAVNPESAQPESFQPYTMFDDNLSFSLPQQLRWLQEDQDRILFAKDGTVIGGITAYEKPELELYFGDTDAVEEWNHREWENSLGLPDASDTTFGFMVGDSRYGDYHVTYFRDLPPEEKEQMGDYVRFHTFFIGTTQVYDVWFDRLSADRELEEEILKTVQLADQIYGESQTIRADELTFVLPEGYALEEGESGNQVIFHGETIVGGLDLYAKTEIELRFGQDWDRSVWNAPEWIEALGVPDAMDSTLGYVGSSSLYGDYEVEYFRDLPPEEKERVGDYIRFHTFFIGEQQVYDLWFDRLTMPEDVEYLILKTVVCKEDVSAPTGETVQGGEVYTDLELLSHTGSFTSSDRTVEYTWNLQNQTIFPEEMPAVEVSQRTLTAEEVKKIAETLFEGAVFYQPEDTFEEEYSKAELQKKLDLWEHYTDEENLAWLYPDRAQPGDTYIQNEADLVRRFVEDYSARLETAPEEKNDAVYDWVYRNNVYGNGYWTQFEYNGIPYQFHSDGTEVSLYIYSGAGPSTIEDDHYEAILTRTEQPTQGQVDAVRTKVDALIQAIDMGSWQITNCYVEAGAYGEYMTSVAQYKIIVDVQPVFEGTESMAWGANNMWFRQGMHLEYAPNGQLMECWLQSFYNLENITQPQPVMDTEDLLQMAEAHLVQNTRSSFGLPEDMFTAMGEEIVCKVTITDMFTGLLLTNHPTSAFRMQYLPGVTFHAGIEYCGAETGKVYLTGEAWTGSALRRILAMDLTNGSIIPYPER